MSSNMVQLCAVRGGQSHEQQKKHSSFKCAAKPSRHRSAVLFKDPIFTCGVSRHTEQNKDVLSVVEFHEYSRYSLVKHQVRASDHRR